MSAPIGESLRRLAASVVAAVETRLALVGADVEVQAAWLGRLFAQAALAFALAILSGAALGAFVVLAFWEHRVAAGGVVALLLVLATVGMLGRVVASLRNRPPLLGSTLEVLAEDRDRLRRGGAE